MILTKFKHNRLLWQESGCGFPISDFRFAIWLTYCKPYYFNSLLKFSELLIFEVKTFEIK